MSKRPADEPLGTDCATLAPELRFWPDKTLSTLRHMSDCMLNPRASNDQLMCNDVLHLIDRQLRAPVLCATVGAKNHPRGWCVYDFDSGWGGVHHFTETYKDVYIHTIMGAVCVEFMPEWLPDHFAAATIDGTGVLWETSLAPQKSDRHSCSMVDDAVLCFTLHNDQLIRCAAGSTTPGPKISLPERMHSRFMPRADVDGFFVIDTGDGDMQSEWSIGITRYDMHAQSASFAVDNVLLSGSTRLSSADGVDAAVQFGGHSLFLLAGSGCYAYDTRSARVRGLSCPPGVFQMHLMPVIVSENVWMIVTRRGQVWEYDVRGNFWRAPHKCCTSKITEAQMQYRPLDPAFLK